MGKCGVGREENPAHSPDDAKKDGQGVARKRKGEPKELKTGAMGDREQAEVL